MAEEICTVLGDLKVELKNSADGHSSLDGGEGQQEPTDRVSSLGSTEEKETRSLIEDTSDVSGESLQKTDQADHEKEQSRTLTEGESSREQEVSAKAETSPTNPTEFVGFPKPTVSTTVEETSGASRNSLSLLTIPSGSRFNFRVFRQGDQGEETLGSDLGDGLSQETSGLSHTNPPMNDVSIQGRKKPRKSQLQKLQRKVAELEDKLDEANGQLQDHKDQLAKAERNFEQSEEARTRLERELAQCMKLLRSALCRECGNCSFAVSHNRMRIGFALLFFNTFSNGHSGLPELKWAKSEGTLLKRVLEEVGYEVKLVFDSEEDEMLRELRAVEEKIDDSDRNVIVFFSTHGGLKESAADDSSEDELEGKNKSSRQGEFIRDSTGRKIFNLEGVLDTHLGSCKGKHILVGVDSCRGEKVHKVNEPLPINRTILYSCTSGYAAHESPDWGSPFVVAFCCEALDCTRNSDISTVVRRVISRVSREKLFDEDSDGKVIRVKQVPEARTTASTAAYLFDRAENEEAIHRRHSF